MPPVRALAEERLNHRLFVLMLGVFFGGGLLASVEALLVPRLMLRLPVGFAGALTVQLIYYAGYLLFAVPATRLLARVGAMRAVAGALAVMAIGCLALTGSVMLLRFDALLAALLLLSAGVSVLQIACNGLMATIGGRERAARRFTFLQAFNALGTVLGPLTAASLVLGKGSRAWAPFLAFALAFSALALLFARHRHLLPDRPAAEPTVGQAVTLLRGRHLRFGVGAIFAYVGAEVTIGSLAVNYMMLPGHGGLDAVSAGRWVSAYWGGAMVGRFVGAWALARTTAPRLLAGAAATAVVLTTAAAVLPGQAGCAALLAIGCCNSIMFPTIYGLAMPVDAAAMPVAAMLLSMAVVGGAVVPMLTGLVADHSALGVSLMVPAACYVVVALFARRAA